MKIIRIIVKSLLPNLRRICSSWERRLLYSVLFSQFSLDWSRQPFVFMKLIDSLKSKVLYIWFIGTHDFDESHKTTCWTDTFSVAIFSEMASSTMVFFFQMNLAYFIYIISKFQRRQWFFIINAEANLSRRKSNISYLTSFPHKLNYYFVTFICISHFSLPILEGK